MKASTALSLGRMLTDNPTPGNIRDCAVGMMLNAEGVPQLTSVIRRSRPNARVVSAKHLYPWLCEILPDGFLEKHKLSGDNFYNHSFEVPNSYYQWLVASFNQNVMRDQTMTLDQLHDIIAEIEPDCGECNSFDCTCLDKTLDNLVQEHTVSLKEIA